MSCQRQKAGCHRLVNAPTCGVNALSTPPKQGVSAGQGPCAADLSTPRPLSLESQRCHQSGEGYSKTYLLTLTSLEYRQVNAVLAGYFASTRGVPLTNPPEMRLTCDDHPEWGVDTALTPQVSTVDTPLTVVDTPASAGQGRAVVTG